MHFKLSKSGQILCVDTPVSSVFPGPVTYIIKIASEELSGLHVAAIGNQVVTAGGFANSMTKAKTFIRSYNHYLLNVQLDPLWTILLAYNREVIIVCIVIKECPGCLLCMIMFIIIATLAV